MKVSVFDFTYAHRDEPRYLTWKVMETLPHLLQKKLHTIKAAYVQDKRLVEC